MKVPEYNDPLPSEDRMNSEQERFYHFWVSSWHAGNAIPLEGQVSYAFCYLYNILSFPVKKVASVLERMYSAYPDEEGLSPYVRRWLSDCYVMERRFPEALEVFPELSLENPTGYVTDKRLNLKLLTGRRISGREALAMLGPRVTASDKTVRGHIAEYMDVLLRAREADKRVNLLETWARDAIQTKYEIFTGYLGAIEIDLPFYHFSIYQGAVEETLSLAREAENTVREEQDSPGIPEAWAAETELCARLKRFFSDEPVIYHSRPPWLEHKHLDILLPKRGIAVEYRVPKNGQGDDVSAFTVPLEIGHNGDLQKRKLCYAHGIQLLEVGPGYNLDSVIARIIKLNRATRR